MILGKERERRKPGREKKKVLKKYTSDLKGIYLHVNTHCSIYKNI